MLFLYVEGFAYGPYLDKFFDAQRRQRRKKRQANSHRKRSQQTEQCSQKVEPDVKSDQIDHRSTTISDSHTFPATRHEFHATETDAFDILGGDVSDVSEYVEIVDIQLPFKMLQLTSNS